MKPLILLFAVVTLNAVSAQVPKDSGVPLTNPGFPSRETFVYSDELQGVRRTIEQTLQFKSEGTVSWYELQTHAFDTDQVVRFDPKSLLITAIDSVTRTKDAVLRRQLQVVQVLRQAGPNELVVNDLPTLPTILRGFPWGKVNFAKLVYLGANAASGDYSFELNVVGQEPVVAGGRTYQCWKAQVGLAGIYGPFVGKTTLWFDMKAPHVLVRLEMPMGGPGSPMRTQVLLSYDAQS